MLSKIKLFVILLLTGVCTCLQANSVPGTPIVSPKTISNDDVCTLLPPSFVNVLEVGTSWVKLAWAPVAGAAQFHIITRDAVTTTIYNSTYVSGAVNAATISGLPTGAICISEVRPVCISGEETNPGTFTTPFGIIIDMVGNGYEAPSNYNLDCEMLFRGPNDVGTCTVDYTGDKTAFKVGTPNGLAFRSFVVFKNATEKKLDVVEDPNGNSSFQFFDEGGHHVRIAYVTGGVSTPIARFTVSAGFLEAKLFRESDFASDNNTSYKIQRYVRGGQLKSPAINDREKPIDEFSFNSSLSASPNPFTNLLDVQIPYSSEENDVKISLYDLQGRFVFSQQFAGGNQMNSISTADLLPGLYLLRVDTGNRSETIKVLKTQ